MLQRLSLDNPMKEGIALLSRALWKWYTWPLGILLWTAFLFHGVIMSMSHAWGETIHGTAIRNMATPADYALIAAAFCFMAALGVFIIARTAGLDLRKMRDWMSETRSQYAAMSRGELIVWLVPLILFSPIMVFLGAVGLFVIPFYLYTITWYISFSFAGKGKIIPPMLPDTRTVNAGMYTVFTVYSVLMVFFYDSITGHLVSISRSDPTYFAPWFPAFFVFAVHYLPYRVFFALRNSRNVTGWITFIASASLVLYETWLRFAP
jgi:hypothetical protein